MPRQRSETTPSRERVLDAAEQLFIARGYAAVTMRHIAEALDVQQAALYYHAPDGKAALYRAVIARHMARQRAGLEAAIAESPPDLEAQLRAVAAWLAAQLPVDLIRMLRADAAQVAEGYSVEMLALVNESLIAPIAGVLETGIARGEIVDGDPTAMAGMVIALMNWSAFLTDQYAHEPWMDAMPAQIVSVLLNGLRPR